MFIVYQIPSWWFEESRQEEERLSFLSAAKLLDPKVIFMEPVEEKRCSSY